MFVVERVYDESSLPASAAAYARDTITLGWEDRTRAHGRRRSDGGVEFGMALPRGAVLRARDCFVLDPERLVVRVVERAEPVLVVTPGTAREWALFAYHIGNRHQPVMITSTALVCPDAPGVEPLLQQHRMPYERAEMPFTPVIAGVVHHH